MADVYSPAEDSWLLEECILKERLSSKRCLDIGTGSGIQSAALFRAGAGEVVAVDINPAALVAAKNCVEKYQSVSGAGKSKFSAVESDLFEKISGLFDLIIFNPPYVPSDGIKWKDLDGGEKGRAVIDRFLKDFPKHLSNNGAVLLLLSSLNLPDEIISGLKRKGFKAEIAGRKKLFFEELLVLRISKAR